MEFLSTDLLVTIMMKLPCKDILMCKCVCKQWYDLLSNPNFTRNHARNSPFSYLILLQRLPADPKSSFLLEFDADEGIIWNYFSPKTPHVFLMPEHHPTPDLLPSISSEDTIIIGSCNGLLFVIKSRWILSCSHLVEKVYCCNPLLGGGCVKITEEESQDFRWRERYNVGYISATDNIKLLRIGFRPSNVMLKQSDILTVGIDRTWRRVDEGSVDWYADTRGVCFDGAYHWILLHKWLCTFDLREEKTGPKFMLPELLQQEMELVVLNNHISLIDTARKNNNYGTIHVWTMREYGISESWYLSRTIMLGDSYRPGPVFPVQQAGILFVCDWGGKKIIHVTNKGGIKVYDFQGDHWLHGAEFTPIFYPPDQTWGALSQTLDA